MLNYLRTKFLLSTIIISPVLLTAASGLAQTAAPSEPGNEAENGQQSEQQTICRYDPESGFPNALGMRTYVTLTESSGSTTVVLEQFPRAIINPDDPGSEIRDAEFNTETIRADIAEVRSLTFYNTPIAAARQLLIDQPFYYAELLNISESGLGTEGTEGFEVIDQTLGCEQVAVDSEASQDISQTEGSAESMPEADPSTETPAKTPTAAPTIADLPNGNYRFASADLENIVVSDEALAAAGGEVFLFRKFGDTITGEMRFLDETGGIFCIGGKVDGNIITGSMASPSDSLRSGDFVEGDVTEDPSVEAALNLSNFSRINAGSQLPIEACSERTYQDL